MHLQQRIQQRIALLQDQRQHRIEQVEADISRLEPIVEQQQAEYQEARRKYFDDTQESWDKFSAKMKSRIAEAQQDFKVSLGEKYKDVTFEGDKMKYESQDGGGYQATYDVYDWLCKQRASAFATEGREIPTQYQIDDYLPEAKFTTAELLPIFEAYHKWKRLQEELEEANADRQRNANDHAKVPASNEQRQLNDLRKERKMLQSQTVAQEETALLASLDRYGLRRSPQHMALARREFLSDLYYIAPSDVDAERFKQTLPTQKAPQQFHIELEDFVNSDLFTDGVTGFRTKTFECVYYTFYHEGNYAVLTMPFDGTAVIHVNYAPIFIGGPNSDWPERKLVKRAIRAIKAAPKIPLEVGEDQQDFPGTNDFHYPFRGDWGRQFGLWGKYGGGVARFDNVEDVPHDGEPEVQEDGSFHARSSMTGPFLTRWVWERYLAGNIETAWLSVSGGDPERNTLWKELVEGRIGLYNERGQWFAYEANLPMPTIQEWEENFEAGVAAHYRSRLILALNCPTLNIDKVNADWQEFQEAMKLPKGSVPRLRAINDAIIDWAKALEDEDNDFDYYWGEVKGLDEEERPHIYKPSFYEPVDDWEDDE